MVESRTHCSHYLTEALQILPHIFELDSLLLFQKLQKTLRRDAAVIQGVLFQYSSTMNSQRKTSTYCFDALMKDRFVDEVKFAKFPDEFNVAKHLDLGNGTLLLLLRSKRVVVFVIDWHRGEQHELAGRLR